MTLTAKRLCLSLSLTALLVPTGMASALAADAPAWTGDYQSGNLTQWTDVHVAKADGAVVVSSPVRNGYSKAGKFTVRPGDRTFGQVNEERAEVMSSIQQSGSVEGAETWHGWSTLFPAGTSVEPGSWLAFSQWHQTANTCPPNVAFMITDSAVPRIRLSVRGGALNMTTCAAASASTYDLGVLPIDSWTDFTVHGKWSSDRARGTMEVKLNGRTVLPPTPVANLYTGQSAYFKQGIYRGNMSRTTVLYHTGTRRGATESSVTLAGVSTAAAPAVKTVTMGSGSRALTGTNIARTTDALVAYDGSYGWTTSPANAYGLEAAVVGGKVVAVRDYAPGMPIPAGGMVLSGHGAARDWLKLHAAVGAAVTVTSAGTTVVPAAPTPTSTPAPTPTATPVPTVSIPTVITSTTVEKSVRVVNGTNVQRTADTLIAYTRAGGRTVSPANPYGFEAAVVNGKVTAVSSRKIGMPIPVGGVVLSAHGTAETWLMANAKVGVAVALR